MIRWFKITFLNFCPECMVGHNIVGCAGADCWEGRECMNEACSIGKKNYEIYTGGITTYYVPK